MIDINCGANIDKDTFASILKLRLKEKGYDIDIFHIRSMVNILLEELAKDLLKGKDICIGGLGRLIFKRMPPRGYFNFQTRKIEKSIGNKLLRFKIDDKLRLKLLNILDINKTFNKDNNEETK